jgi:predicted NBD/HSP70 family sugar kinase
MVVDPDGSRCRCGKKGCISAYSNIYSIHDAARQAYANGEWERNNDAELITFEEITAAARRGEPALCQIFARAGYFLGTGMAGLIQIFNPAKIILSGKGVQAGNLMFGPMHKAIRAQTNKELLATTEIVVQKWRDTDWAHGAASLVLQELYKSPFNRLGQMI